MKNFRNAIVMATLVIGFFGVLVCDVFAQAKAPFENAESAFVALESSGKLKSPVNEIGSKSVEKSEIHLVQSNEQPTSRGLPPLFQLQADREVLGEGQEINFTLNFPFGRTGPLFMYGRRHEPGKDGVFQGSLSYVNIKAGFYGLFEYGIPGPTIFPDIYSQKFNGGDQWGNYLLELIIVDTYGNLVQQVFHPYYFKVVVNFQRDFMSIDFVQPLKIAKGEMPQVLLTGHFPRNTPLLVNIGAIASNNYMQTRAISHDGKTLIANTGFCIEGLQLVVTASVSDPDGSRYTVSKPEAVVAQCPRR